MALPLAPAAHFSRGQLVPSAHSITVGRSGKNRQHGRCPAALPADALESLPTAAAAAVAGSLLTAFWMRRGEGSAAQPKPGAPHVERPAQSSPADDVPCTAEGIWAAAWRGFADAPRSSQKQQEVDLPASAANSSGSQQPSSSTAQQPRLAAAADTGQTNAADGVQPQQAEQEGEDDSLQRNPVLLLQGIRASDRSQLLALCLAALEAQITALPAGAGLLAGSTTAAHWRQLSVALLALSSLAAAAAWLGYVPSQLLEAAARKLAAADTAVLKAAGLAAAAASVRQQAAAAAALDRDNKLSSNAGSSSSRRKEDTDAQEDSTVDGTAVDWYCLEEKLQVYSSVLRLLTCSFFEQQQQQPAGQQMTQQASAAALNQVAAEAEPGEHAPATQEAPLPAAASTVDAAALARSQALQLLQQQQRGGSLGAIRGWRASSGGARTDSQLLSLAPAILQDMAVTAADAVAAAYLADAATAGPTLSAVRGADVSSAGVTDSAGSGSSSSSNSRARARESAAVAAAQQRQDRRQQRQGGTAAGRQQARGWWRHASASWGEGLAASVIPTTASSGSLVGPAGEGSIPASSASSGTADGSSGTAGSSLEAGWWPTFVHPQLGSTRQLQRFTNRVTLNRWVQRHYTGVADIYEDRLRLFGVAAAGRRLLCLAAALKRTPELGRLKGLRYAASLLFEAVDMAAPLLRTLWSRATSAFSWLLVRLVGQAVALFRKGIQRGSGGQWQADGAGTQETSSAAADGTQQAGGNSSGSSGARQQQAVRTERLQRRRRRQQGSGRNGLEEAEWPGWAWL